MRHWHRRHTKGEEQTNYDVKPPVHLLCRLASLELKRKRIILHFTRVTLAGSSDPCKGSVMLFHDFDMLHSFIVFGTIAFQELFTLRHFHLSRVTKITSLVLDDLTF